MIINLINVLINQIYFMCFVMIFCSGKNLICLSPNDLILDCRQMSFLPLSFLIYMSFLPFRFKIVLEILSLIKNWKSSFILILLIVLFIIDSNYHLENRKISFLPFSSLILKKMGDLIQNLRKSNLLLILYIKSILDFNELILHSDELILHSNKPFHFSNESLLQYLDSI